MNKWEFGRIGNFEEIGGLGENGRIIPARPAGGSARVAKFILFIMS